MGAMFLTISLRIPIAAIAATVKSRGVLEGDVCVFVVTCGGMGGSGFGRVGYEILRGLTAWIVPSLLGLTHEEGRTRRLANCAWRIQRVWRRSMAERGKKGETWHFAAICGIISNLNKRQMH